MNKSSIYPVRYDKLSNGVEVSNAQADDLAEKISTNFSKLGI